MALLGYLGIVVALGGSMLLAYLGARHARDAHIDSGTMRRVSAAVLAGAVVAMVALEIAILSHDFSIEYVANNTSTTTPFLFLMASGWAALEGSIVLWGLMLAIFTFLVARRLNHGDGLGIGALGVMGFVGAFWFGVMATVANPFALCSDVVNGVCAASSGLPLGAAVAPAEGLGPNPLLQNHILMAIHPPMLYVGYVGFTVPFAFAISAMWRGDQGPTWLDRTHRWSLAAWTFLTLGIFLGGWWSYEVLGWGGYWAWDPVENAAFLPWLVGTAFIHSAIVQRRRGMLQAWNLILIIATFALTIFGTFLTRSGTIFSVHSFTQSLIGPVLLAFLGVVLVGSLALFAWRAPLMSSAPRMESLASREGMFMLNNLLLTLFAITVLVGTMYPLALEAFSGRQVTVGRPFFDKASIPIAFALLLAMGVGPVTPWRVARPGVVWERTRTPLIVSLFVGAGAVLVGIWSVPVVIVLVLAAFVIGVIIRLFVATVNARRRSGAGAAAAAASLFTRQPGFWGGQVAHIGVALAAVAIAASSALAFRTEVRLDVGESVMVEGYCLEYESPVSIQEAHRRIDGVNLVLLRADCSTEVARLRPSLNFFANSGQAVATPSVHTGLVEDVYVNIAAGDSESVVLDVSVFPLMWLLWTAGLIIVAGGTWSFAASRSRRSRPGAGVTAEPTVTDRELASTAQTSEEQDDD